ncbi:MAG TPA: nitroreductase family deazaflavin-dependent oxidoreductase [Dehalococcoidia bacterium]|nr:nitroreductase family deazaflavin-dependent oxidoreductase [Dehalococcoidia bacterium]
MTQQRDQRAIDAETVAQYRATGGHVERFADGTMLVLTTTGAKSGRPHVKPLRFIADGDRIAIIASHQGAPKSPDWYHNLVANPRVTVEVGSERFEAVARIATGEERERLYAAQAARMPQFAEYETRTTRVIPVVVLERV